MPRDDRIAAMLFETRDDIDRHVPVFRFAAVVRVPPDLRARDAADFRRRLLPAACDDKKRFGLFQRARRARRRKSPLPASGPFFELSAPRHVSPLAPSSAGPRLAWHRTAV